MVQSLPGFPNLCLYVCSPSQVLGDVYAEVLEAAYSLHRGPTDHKRGVGQQVFLPEVYNQLFSGRLVKGDLRVLSSGYDLAPRVPLTVAEGLQQLY